LDEYANILKGMYSRKNKRSFSPSFILPHKNMRRNKNEGNRESICRCPDGGGDMFNHSGYETGTDVPAFSLEPLT